MQKDNLLAAQLASRKLKIIPFTHYIYAIFCQSPGSSSGFVKFGYTKNLFQRFGQLKTGCPLPVKYYAIRKHGTYAHAAWLTEQSLHERFRARRSSGEWFSFDFSSKEDKDDFNQGCREVLGYNLKTGKTWERFSAADLAKLNKEQQSKFLKSKKNRDMYKRAGHSAERSTAWSELRRYGMSSEIR